MGASTHDTVKEIRNTRDRLGRDLEELSRRVAAAEHGARSAGIALACAAACGLGLAIAGPRLWRTRSAPKPSAASVHARLIGTLAASAAAGAAAALLVERMRASRRRSRPSGRGDLRRAAGAVPLRT